MILEPMTHVYDLWHFTKWVKSELGLTEKEVTNFIRSHNSELSNGTMVYIPKLSFAIEEEYEMSDLDKSIYKLIEDKLNLDKEDETISVYYWW